MGNVPVKTSFPSRKKERLRMFNFKKIIVFKKIADEEVPLT